MLKSTFALASLLALTTSVHAALDAPASLMAGTSDLQCSLNESPKFFDRLKLHPAYQSKEPSRWSVLEPNAHWFRGQLAGETADTIIKLTNRGDRWITLTEVDGLSAEFSLANALPIKIAPSASTDLNFSYTPDSGPKSDSRSYLDLVFADGARQKAYLWGQSIDGRQSIPVTECGTLDQANTRYILMNDVSSADSCFLIGAKNIVLDLGGYKVTYDTNGQATGDAEFDDYVPGIVSAASWAPRSKAGMQSGFIEGLEITNGTIEQAGYSDGSVVPGKYGHGIYLNQQNQSSDIDINHVTINVHGHSAKNLHAEQRTRLHIHNNVFNSKVTEIVNRHQYDGAQVKFGQSGSAAEHGGFASVHDNRIIGSSQVGVAAGIYNSQIFDNYFAQNSYFTNDFAIITSGHSDAFRNTLRPISGRGIMGQREHTRIFDNDIEVIGLKRNTEYGGCQGGGVYGIQLENTAKHNLVFDNTVVAKADECNAVALKVTGNGKNETDSAFQQLQNFVYRNSFYAKKLANDNAGTPFSMAFSATSHAEALLSYKNVYRSDGDGIALGWGGILGAEFIQDHFSQGENPISVSGKLINFGNSVAVKNLWLEDLSLDEYFNYDEMHEQRQYDWRGPSQYFRASATEVQIKDQHGRKLNGATLELNNDVGSDFARSNISGMLVREPIWRRVNSTTSERIETAAGHSPITLMVGAAAIKLPIASRSDKEPSYRQFQCEYRADNRYSSDSISANDITLTPLAPPVKTDGGSGGVVITTPGMPGASGISSSSSSSSSASSSSSSGSSNANPGTDSSSKTLSGRIAQGETIILRAPNGVSFGDLGPELVFRTTLLNSSVDAAMDLTDYSGVGVLAANHYGAPKVESISAMPYGRALAFGALEDPEEKQNGIAYEQLKIDYQHKPTTRTYEHVVAYWPAEHQANAAPYLQGVNTWGMKPIWNFENGGYRADNINFFAGHISGYYNPTQEFRQCTSLLSTNSLPSVYATCEADNTWTQYTGSPELTTAQREFPLVIQTGYDLGSEAYADDGSAHYRVTDTVRGLMVSNYEKSLDFTPASDNWTNKFHIDSANWPGYIRGFPQLVDAHIYEADLYKTRGPGAWARVEICENENYDQCKRISPFTILNWSADKISAEVYEGFFYGDSLDGKWLHVHNADWNLVYSIKITAAMISNNQSIKEIDSTSSSATSSPSKNSNSLAPYNIPAPASITGDIVDGNYLTLNGKYFSEKINTKPLFYWEADGGKSPSTLGRKLKWDNNNGFNGDIVDASDPNAQLAPGSSKVAQYHIAKKDGAILGKVSFETGKSYVWRKRRDGFSIAEDYPVMMRYNNLTNIVPDSTLKEGMLVASADKHVWGKIQWLEVERSGTEGKGYYSNKIGNIGEIESKSHLKYLADKTLFFYNAEDINLTTPILTAQNGETYGYLITLNHKSIRFWADYGSLPQSVVVSPCFSGAAIHHGGGIHLSHLGETAYCGDFDNWLEQKPHQWVTEEFEYEAGSIGASDSVFKYFMDNVLAVKRGFEISTVEHPEKLKDIYQFQAPHGAQLGSYEYYDSLYIDDSRHRIIICESSIYSNCSKPEIQIPTIWSDTEIQFQARLKAFQNPAALYIYVADKNGEINEQGLELCNPCYLL